MALIRFGHYDIRAETVIILASVDTRLDEREREGALLQSTRRLLELDEGITAEIVEERDNRVVGRREYAVKIYHIGKGTPSIPDIRVKLAEKLGVEYKRLFIRKLNTEYGMGVSNAIVNVYDTVEKAMLFEPKYVIERNKTLEEEIEEAEG